MRIDAVELRVVALPMVAPFVAGHGTVEARTSVLVHLVGPDGEGWGECAALPDPTYTAEFTDAALLVLRDHLAPRLLHAAARRSDGLAADELATALDDVVGHPMAEAALELALLDAEGRAAGTALARRLFPHPPGPATTVPAGAVIGLAGTTDAVVTLVADRVAQGYGRVKLKVAPGRDVELVRAVRDAVGPDVVLVADANGAYRLDGAPGAPDDARLLADLDDLGLACIEQPLAADDLLGHAELARRIATPICLDESLTTVADTEQALDMGACSVVCVKAPRYGSWLAAADVLDRCAGNGVAAWVGGMLDAGIGRHANVALAAHPGATVAGDIADGRLTFTDDVTAPVELTDGVVRVPDGPGIGIDVDPAAIDRLTVSAHVVRL